MHVGLAALIQRSMGMRARILLEMALEPKASELAPTHTFFLKDDGIKIIIPDLTLQEGYNHQIQPLVRIQFLQQTLTQKS
jgi:hypothetical protein